MLAGEGGLLADALLDDGLGRGVRGAGRPRGRRAPGGGRSRRLRVRRRGDPRGPLLHDGRSRLLDQSDPDLALLAGDRLYALGLERLAALGDLEAVAILAEVISRCAQARAEGTPQLAAEAWEDATRQLAGDVAP